jgi:hypothetical protein
MKSLQKLLPILLLLTLLSPTQAQLIINGGMDSSNVTLNLNSHNNVVPDGWTAVGVSTPDTFSAATTFFSYTFPNNNSGQFTHLSAIGGTYSEGVYQNVIGATLGQAYILEFDQGIDLAFYGNEGGGYNAYLSVTIAGSVYTTTPVPIPTTHNASSPWTRQQISFTAPSTAFEVQFNAESDTFGERVDTAIDNITLSPVPEPSFSCLLALLVTLGLWSRRR